MSLDNSTSFASSSRSSSQRTEVLSNYDEDIFDTSIDISYDGGYSFDASSPVSSPGGPVDSSPPSSPGLMGNVLDDDDEDASGEGAVPCTDFANSFTSLRRPCTFSDVPITMSMSGFRPMSMLCIVPMSSPSG